ncbi:RnfH family protein [Acidovorax sp. FG27]|uniref:RnfH family protein n=1 Tax=Acidovorax sp. FG27 TaxID=3133652 RepID=UPI0030E9BEFC
MAEPAGTPSPIQVAVVASIAPGEVREWSLRLPAGACVSDALKACGLDPDHAQCSSSVWGRAAPPGQALRDQDRVEWCRALLVDPKVARRQRFARQGARTAGLFADRRPGAKAGY